VNKEVVPMWRNSTLFEETPWIFALALAAFLVFGCASCENNKGTDPNSEASETSYFPLEVGNKWVYKNNYKTSGVDDDTTWTNEVTGTEEKEGQEYSVVSWWHFLGGRKENRYYRTVKTDSVDALYWDEQLLYDFSAPAGTSWKITKWGGPRDYTLVTLESRSDTVEVPAGKFVNCLCFSFELGALLGWYSEWLAPNVGVVKAVWKIGRPLIPLPKSVCVLECRDFLPQSVRTFDDNPIAALVKDALARKSVQC